MSWIPEIESVSCVMDSISSRFSRVFLRTWNILRPTGPSGTIISGTIRMERSARRQFQINIATTVVTMIAMFVTIDVSVPVTTLSMLSTSLETRFMISPVLVPVKKLSGILCRWETSRDRISRMMPSPTTEFR